MLKGKKVFLRPAILADQRTIFAWLTQSDLTHNMMGPPDFNDHKIPTWKEFADDYNEQYFSDTHPDRGRSFIIEVNDEAIGHINYNNVDRNTNTVELDIWLGGSQYANKGFGSDAINTLCDYLHNELGCENFIMAPSVRNKSAIRVYEKCGFEPANIIPDNFVPDYYDTVIMIRVISGKMNR